MYFDEMKLPPNLFIPGDLIFFGLFVLHDPLSHALFILYERLFLPFVHTCLSIIDWSNLIKMIIYANI